MGKKDKKAKARGTWGPSSKTLTSTTSGFLTLPNGVFGEPLEEIVATQLGLDAEDLSLHEDESEEQFVPYVVLDCIAWLRKTPGAMDTDGLFRIPGETQAVHALRELYTDPSEDVTIPPDAEIEAVASLLKLYFRELPSSPMDEYLYPAFVATARAVDEEEPELALENLKMLMEKLPTPNKQTVSVVIAFLAEVARNSEKNMMTADNLSICWAPNMLRPEAESQDTMFDSKFVNMTIRILIEDVTLADKKVSTSRSRRKSKGAGSGGRRPRSGSQRSRSKQRTSLIDRKAKSTTALLASPSEEKRRPADPQEAALMKLEKFELRSLGSYCIKDSNFEVKTHKYGMNSEYPDSFTGKYIIDFLVERKKVSDRPDAVYKLGKMLEYKYVKHVAKPNVVEFVDSDAEVYFFFTKNTASGKPLRTHTPSSGERPKAATVGHERGKSMKTELDTKLSRSGHQKSDSASSSGSQASHTSQASSSSSQQGFPANPMAAALALELNQKIHFCDADDADHKESRPRKQTKSKSESALKSKERAEVSSDGSDKAPKVPRGEAPRTPRGEKSGGKGHSEGESGPKTPRGEKSGDKTPSSGERRTRKRGETRTRRMSRSKSKGDGWSDGSDDDTAAGTEKTSLGNRDRVNTPDYPAPPPPDLTEQPDGEENSKGEEKNESSERAQRRKQKHRSERQKEGASDGTSEKKALKRTRSKTSSRHPKMERQKSSGTLKRIENGKGNVDPKGVVRGECLKCGVEECAEYVAPTEPGEFACSYCGCPPAKHVRFDGE